MSGVKKYGVSLTTKPQTATGYEVSVGPDGACSATVTYAANASNFKLTQLPVIGSEHPDFKQLKLWDTKATREAGNIMRVISTYKGVGVPDPTILAVYEFNLTSTQDPILTHPKFAGVPDVAAGQQYPLPKINQAEVKRINTEISNGEIYTKENVYTPANNFNGSAPSVGTKGIARRSTQIGRLYYLLKTMGIESYLNPTGSLKKSFVANNIINQMYIGLGYIVNANNIPKVGQIYEVCKANKRSLLYTGLSWKIQGACITVTQDYQMSGYGGWNYILYTSPNGTDPTALTAGDQAQAGADSTEPVPT
ncbi:MAG: hypothetical protein NTW48_08790 [Chloroflexi bacterium]|nr:hypothetical protein [Chloroflexota bacterium]